MMFMVTYVCMLVEILLFFIKVTCFFFLKEHGRSPDPVMRVHVLIIKKIFTFLFLIRLRNHDKKTFFKKIYSNKKSRTILYFC
jgi:hypothetical protein